MAWVLDMIKEVFEKPMRDAGFCIEHSIRTWHSEGERYSRGNLGVEIILTAESSFRVEVWLRKLGEKKFADEYTWSREDIDLGAFCSRQGLALPAESPSLVDEPDYGESWRQFFQSNLEVLMRVVNMLPLDELN